MSSEASASASDSERPAERSAMRRALDLAWRGWGRVAPNPLVGAVILQGDTVVGEGFHAEYGGPHAEVAALAAAGARARGATLIVTLEPCAHRSEERRVGKEWRSRWAADGERRKGTQEMRDRDVRQHA